MGDVRIEEAANMKTLNFRALATWICLFLFLVFLTLRLDDKILWSWYIVFIPLWILDAAIFYHVAARMFNIFSVSIAAPPRRARVIQLVGSDALFLAESNAGFRQFTWKSHISVQDNPNQMKYKKKLLK